MKNKLDGFACRFYKVKPYAVSELHGRGDKNVMSDKTYTLICPDRRSALRAWLACFGISKKKFAEALGIHPTRVSGILASDTAPALVILKMHEFGVPDNLLPKRSRRKGRPRGHVQSE